MAENHVNSYRKNMQQLSEEVNRVRKQLTLSRDENELLNEQLE